LGSFERFILGIIGVVNGFWCGYLMVGLAEMVGIVGGYR